VITAQHCVDTEKPAGTSITLAGTTIKGTSDRIYIFGQYDIALVHLATPMPVAGSTTGFLNPIYSSDTKSLDLQTLTCYGRGYTDNANSTGFGTWRTAKLRAAAASDDQYSFRAAAGGPFLAKGDSGGPCFIADPGGTLALTGIQSSLQHA